MELSRYFSCQYKHTLSIPTIYVWTDSFQIKHKIFPIRVRQNINLKVCVQSIYVLYFLWILMHYYGYLCQKGAWPYLLWRFNRYISIWCSSSNHNRYLPYHKRHRKQENLVLLDHLTWCVGWTLRNPNNLFNAFI